jgi:hypothetical protein
VFKAGLVVVFGGEVMSLIINWPIMVLDRKG